MLRPQSFLLYIPLAVALCFCVLGIAAEPETPTKPYVPTDVRVPVDPKLAESTLVALPGFRAQLAAAEPLVHDPMAMEFAADGSAYVLEIPAYNEYIKPEPRTSGSVARLEDTDGDGRFDRRTTFAEGLKYPTGLFCYDGGVFVGDSPNLLYLKDTDGDGRADVREVVYAGFGAAQAGESQLNSFRWGLDNRIHISTGLDGGELRAGDSPEESPRNVRSRRILLEPRGRSIELTSGAGQHGMSFDDWGRVFASGNSTPIDTITYDDRYIERNPLMLAPSPVISLGPGAGFTQLARISPPDAWRVIRSELKDAGAEFEEPFEAGRASGVITSATGVTIYRGHAWPKEYRGQAFIGEVANNVVFRARINVDGLNVSSQHIDSDTDFLASTDTWFRPAQFAHGPDGNLYVIDMYRELIEGVQWVPHEVLSKMDPTAGSDRGRIYRIAPTNFKFTAPQRLDRMTSTELVQQLASENSWHRETAARLLYERQDKSVAKALRELLQNADSPLARLHAMYTLDGLDLLTADEVLDRLADSHPRIREHALRLAEQFAANSPAIRKAMVAMTNDADVAVLQQLAFSLGSVPVDECVPALVKLILSNGSQPAFQLACQSSLSTGAPAVVASILQGSSEALAAPLQGFLATLANQIGRSKHDDDIQSLVQSIDTLPESDYSNAIAKKLIVAMLAEGAGTPSEAILAHSKGRVKNVLTALLSEARTTALDSNASDEQRLQAITILGCGPFDNEQETFDELLTPQQSQPIQEFVVAAVGRSTNPEVAKFFISKWPTLTPALRASVSEILLSRPAWATLLLTAVENGEVSPGDFDPARISLLKNHPDSSIREKATTVFAENGGIAHRAEVVEKYRQALELAGKPEQGRQVFLKTCSACHALEGQGTTVGADLNSIRDRGREAILLNVLDPNREINPKYLSYAATTNDGRVIIGMITEETPNNITIRQADGVPVAISRTNLDSVESTGMSYMPEGLESQLDLQAMADLLAYLMSIGAAPSATK